MLVAVLLAGCTHGFASSGNLESQQQSPRFCAQRCAQDGLQMAGYVYVGTAITACVCQPVNTVGGQMAQGDVANFGAVAAAQALIEQQAAANAQQQQRQRQAATSR